MLGVWALVPLESVLELGVWFVLSVLASQLSKLANCLLILLLWQGLDYEQVEKVGLLAIRLVIGLVVGVSSQLGSLFTEIILGPGTGKTVLLGWTVLDRDFGDKQSLL